MKNAMNNDSQVIVSKKDRLHWVDYSKTIGMYLVVLGHVKDNTLLLKGIIHGFIQTSINIIMSININQILSLIHIFLRFRDMTIKTSLSLGSR